MKNHKILFAAVVLAACTSSPVTKLSAQEIDLLSFAIGHYDIFDNNSAMDFRFEYRPDSKVFIENLKPWAGAEITSDTSVWVGTGLLYDFKLSDNFFLTPSFGAGFYTKGSSDKDLDFPIQFRSQLEVSYQFENNSRLGLGISHMSNANLGTTNPGTEVLSVYWHVPLEKIF